ncbi:hypothetical protein V1289_008537 [Bradyrhizobium sp. AZCC 2289]
MTGPASPLDVHPDLRIRLNAVEGVFAKLTRRRLKRGTFRSVVDLQVANEPFVWIADPKRVLAAVKRGNQVIHWMVLQAKQLIEAAQASA